MNKCRPVWLELGGAMGAVGSVAAQAVLIVVRVGWRVSGRLRAGACPWMGLNLGQLLVGYSLSLSFISCLLEAIS